MRTHFVRFIFLCLTLLLAGPTYSASNTPLYAEGQILVKYKPHVSTAMRAQTGRTYGAKQADDIGNGLNVTHLPAGQSVEQALSLYANDPNIEYAQPNYIYHKLAQPGPTLDPDYGKLWAVKNTGQQVNGTWGTAGDDMNLEAAWNVQNDCSQILVAVVDSGINYNATDLAGSMWNGGVNYPYHGWNFVDKNNNPMDYDGHGTHLAGIIGATGGNGTGITGVCWKANIMAVRVLGANGGYTADIISGIDFAVANGAKIINLSLGGNVFDLAFSNAITRAQNAGVLVVTAAGNESTNNDSTPLYPCNFTQPNILCVAALNQDYALSSFSNWGLNSVDVGAPGNNIYSAWAGIEKSIDLLGPFSSGYLYTSSTTNTGWGAYSNGGQMILTDPKSSWSSARYQTGTDDRAYKILNLSTMANAYSVTLTVATAVNVTSTDSFRINYNASGGDPFVGGTSVYGLSSTHNGLIPALYDFDLKGCVTTSCSVGVQLLSSASSTRDIGVYIPYFTVHSLTLDNNGYYTASGTSMATPQVSGVAALVWAHNPAFTFADVANAIKQGGRSVSALAGKTATGKAVDALGALTYIAPPSNLTVNVQ